jgi:hypothetical protein
VPRAQIEVSTIVLSLLGVCDGALARLICHHAEVLGRRRKMVVRQFLDLRLRLRGVPHWILAREADRIA